MRHLHHVPEADHRGLSDLKRLGVQDDAIVFEHFCLVIEYEACGTP